MSKQSGFTLMELLIVIALIVTVTLVAIPNIIAFLPEYRLRAAAQDLFANIQKAKLTAVKQNTPTALTFTGTGYQIFVDADENFVNGGEEVVVDVGWAAYKSVSEGTNTFDNSSGLPTIAFRSNTIPTDNGGGVANGSVILSNTSGKSMKVSISQAGGVRIE